MSKPKKYACICGWIGKEPIELLTGTPFCPHCSHKRRTRRVVYPVIPCPWCETPKHVQLIGENMYRCHKCERSFDDDPDEGGDYLRDPVRGAINKEMPNDYI